MSDFKAELKARIGKPANANMDNREDMRNCSLEQVVDIWELRKEGYGLHQLVDSTGLSYCTLASYINKVNMEIKLSNIL